MANHYDIRQPNGIKFRMIYNKLQNRITLLEKTLLKTWKDFCETCWLYFGKIGFKMSCEDKTKFFLDKCGSFLLIGEYKKSNILTEGKERQIKDNEVLFCDAPPEVQDMFYSSNNKEIDEYSDTGKNFRNKDNTKNNKPNKSKETKEYINHYKQRNNNLKLIYEDLDMDKLYNSKWCLVDTDKIFEYNNQRFNIKKDVEQYQPEKICINPRANDKNKVYDCIYKMDKILVVEQDNHHYYYDMSYNKIHKKYVVHIK